jgi:hypothetical protein
VEFETLKARSAGLVDRLVEAVGCERSWVTLELVETRFVADGGETKANPFIEVLWFPRDGATKKRVAAILAEELKGEADYATVVFTDLARGDYFENGVSFEEA